jgi:tetratricopeptide (TPR) repeat protein
VRTLQVVLFLSICAIVAGCNATKPDLTPISDPTQRLEFEGFSILPPRAKGWNRLIWMEQQQPKAVPNVPVRALFAVRAYFIKRLSEEATSPSGLHRLTAVVRTFNVEDLKVESHIGFLKEMAEGFSGETFLDKFFGRDCFRYQSTSEVQNPKFPNSVFVISKHGFVLPQPTSSTLFIMVEYRQYYAQGVQPLSAEALKREVEPFQNSLEFSSTPPITPAPTPDRWSAHYNQGITYLQKGKLDKAISEFSKALELNSRIAKVYYNRGLAYGKKGQYDNAISDNNKAIELNPKYAWAYYNRGLAYSNKGQLDKAISDYTKAIEIDPMIDRAYYNRGLAYHDKGQYDNAISDYTEAIELNPKHLYAYNNRGNAYRTKGQYDKAISDYTKAIDIDPRIAKVYSNRGFTYFYIKEYDNAWSDVNKAQSLGYKIQPEFLKDLREASGR